jgi:hypothetical protein
LQAGRQLGLFGRLRAGLADGLIQQILEHRARALEAGRGDVGEVVGNDIHRCLLRFQTGFGNPQ